MKRYFNISLFVLVLWVGMLLVGCRSGPNEPEESIEVAGGGEKQEEPEPVDGEDEDVNSRTEQDIEPKTLADQLIGTWILTKSDFNPANHYYHQFSEDGVYCWDASVDWLGKLPNQCKEFSVEGDIMTIVCPEDGKDCFARETCNYKVIITEENVLILEPDTESCGDFWNSRYSARRVDVNHFERVDP